MDTCSPRAIHQGRGKLQPPCYSWCSHVRRWNRELIQRALFATQRAMIQPSSPMHVPKYDHFTFPGAVPRTFIGSVLLAWISTPIIWLATWLGLVKSKLELQIIGMSLSPPFFQLCLSFDSSACLGEFERLDLMFDQTRCITPFRARVRLVFLASDMFPIPLAILDGTNDSKYVCYDTRYNYLLAWGF